MSAAYRFANTLQPNIPAMVNVACGFGLLFADDSRQIAQSYRWRCRT